MGDKIGALAVSYHSENYRGAYQHKPLPSTGRYPYRVTVLWGGGIHKARFSVAAFSPLRGQGVSDPSL